MHNGLGSRIKGVIHYLFNPAYINPITQHDYSLEIESTFQVGKKITIPAYYAYVFGDNSTKSKERDTTHFNLIRRPKHSFGVNVGYHITPLCL